MWSLTFIYLLQNLVTIERIGVFTVTKYATGDMQITGTTTTGAGVKVHHFPTPFIETPFVVYSAQCYDITASTYIGYVDRVTKTGFNYVVKGLDDSARTEGVRYIATGKWK